MFLMLAGGSALAAKGGVHGKGGGGTTSTSCTACVLTVSPNPMPIHTQPTVTGTGFTPGGTYYVRVNGDIFSTIVTADSSGGFSFVYTYKDLYQAGDYQILATSTSWVTVASFTFTATQ